MFTIQNLFNVHYRNVQCIFKILFDVYYKNVQYVFKKFQRIMQKCSMYFLKIVHIFGISKFLFNFLMIIHVWKVFKNFKIVHGLKKGFAFVKFCSEFSIFCSRFSWIVRKFSKVIVYFKILRCLQTSTTYQLDWFGY